MKQRVAGGITVFALALLLTSNGGGQMQMPACHIDPSGQFPPPSELPPPQRMTGLGTVVFPISANAEAQTWFEQGINLFFDFWDYESARAFEQSIRADPSCAICYWGLYQAEAMHRSEGLKFGREALKKAVELSGRATAREKLYIQAADAHEEAAATPHSIEEPAQREVRILRTLVKKNPHDTNARIFLAEALEDGFDKSGEPRPGQKEAQTLLQGVLHEEPQNSAAHHLFIHAVEPGAHPEQALASADILGSLAPASGHMVHMPGHIYYRLGEYARAQAAFDASTKADESYMRLQHVAVDDDWNYVHNLMYSVANLLEEGRFEQASLVSAKLVEARGHRAATLYPWSPRDGIARINPELPIALRSGDWTQAIKLINAASLPPGMPHLELLAGDLAEFVLGMQAVEAHQPEAAERHSLLLDAHLWRLSQQVQEEAEQKKKAEATPTAVMPTDPLLEPLLKTLTVMSLELRGTVLALHGNIPDAERVFSRASEKEVDLGYREPPNYIRPASEGEAAAWIAAGKWSAAEAAYRQALKDRPRSGFALYGIALAEEQSGAADGTANAYRAFLAAWKTADHELPQIEHAHQWLAQHANASASQQSSAPLPH